MSKQTAVVDEIKPQGIGPMLGRRPSFDCEGQTYEIKRLGMDECFEVFDVLTGTVRSGAFGAAAIGPAAEGSIGMAVSAGILSGVVASKDRILGLIAKITVRRTTDGTEEINAKDLHDAEQFPAWFLLRWVRILTTHPDWTLFFEEAQEIKGQVIAMLSSLLSSGLSIDSNATPAGPTTS